MGAWVKNTILVDFDGVIRHWPNFEIDKRVESLGLESNPLFSCAFSERQLRPAITGIITHQEWCENVKFELAQKYGDRIATDLVNSWYQLDADIDFEFLENIRNSAKNSRLVLVTNATSRLDSDLTRAGLEYAFDSVINSSIIGVEKPEQSFFRMTMQLLNVAASDCVFIDDSLKNVESARSVGIDSIWHKCKEETLKFISEIGA
jgi:putative hydrolase of the HAD superfamily